MTARARASEDAALEPGSPSIGPQPIERERRFARNVVVAATMVFFATCMGFLINTPTDFNPDETFQFDRVMAAWGGQVVLDPEEINVSVGSRQLETVYYGRYTRGGPNWAIQEPTLREDRPSYSELGGNVRSPERDVSNYMTQHPPLYYGLMGGLTWLVPGATDMAGDALFLLIRFFNVLLLLPLPFLFWFSAKELIGRTSVAAAAAFLPLLVPGLARVSASINNDNLAIVLGAAIVGFSIKVMRGDRSTRTAAALAVLAVAGSLTKATIMFVLVVIPVAYGLQAIRARAWPGKRVLLILILGAVGASAWWLRNLFRLGVIQPSALGTQWAKAQGPPRPADVPVDMGLYWQEMADKMPSRIFAPLGRLEPPQLPSPMIWILTVSVLIAIPVAIAALPGRRWDLGIIVALPLASIAMVLFQVYRHYLSYVALTGVQGRYAYPAIFGLIFPIAIVAGLILRRRRRWTPMLVAAGGLVVSGWALYTSVEYFWLPRGESLIPSNWVQALEKMAGFAALPGPVTAVLIATILALVAGGITIGVLACARQGADAEPLAESAART